MVGLLSVLLTDKLKRFLSQFSVLENLKNAVMQADQAFLIPVTVKRRSTADTFLVRATPTSSPSSCSSRGCKHFLPQEQPAVGPRLPLLGPPAAALGLGLRSRLQGYVISTTPSNTAPKATHTHTHTHIHKQTASLANHFSSRDVLAKQK